MIPSMTPLARVYLAGFTSSVTVAFAVLSFLIRSWLS